MIWADPYKQVDENGKPLLVREPFPWGWVALEAIVAVICVAVIVC